jgi:hypothetical protein
MSRRRDASGLGLALVGGAVVAGILLLRRRQDPTAAAAAAAPGGGTDGPQAADDVDALGRVITSEADRYSERERRAIGWTVRNRARRRGVSIARLVCYPSCGAQGPIGKGYPARPFSTARAATAKNLALAREILAAPQSDDPTGGALAFFEPKVQDLLVQQGRPGYRLTANDVREKWIREGQQQRGTVGAFEFFA